jgi:hypothetical protein
VIGHRGLDAEGLSTIRTSELGETDCSLPAENPYECSVSALRNHSIGSGLPNVAHSASVSAQASFENNAKRLTRAR